MPKTFDEFRNSLTEEDIIDIVESANPTLKAITNDNQGIGNQMAAISLGINLALLERYHSWLQQD